jgi:hypothetical protein
MDLIRQRMILQVRSIDPEPRAHRDGRQAGENAWLL